MAENSKRPLVEFFTTSARLADAWRNAAKRNRKLARCASIHDLAHGVMPFKAVGPANGDNLVVLSHADEDHRALTDTHAQRLIASAFHLLFTEPATHPEQVALWMRATSIRSASRLHVVRVESLEGPTLSDLLGRICSAFGPNGSRDVIVDTYLAGNDLLVWGARHRVLRVPLSAIPALNGQPLKVLQNFRIDPDGSFIAWPDVDVHLGWQQFLQAVNPAELHKAQQRSAEFNRRYGAAIRKVREATGIRQSEIAGLTDRQIRRIEHGVCRATPAALAALAEAHGMDVNAYMEKLAKAMR